MPYISIYDGPFRRVYQKGQTTEKFRIKMEDVIDIEGVPCYVESYSLGSDGEITIILKGNMRYRNGAYNIVSPPKEERDVVDALRETYSEDNDE